MIRDVPENLDLGIPPNLAGSPLFSFDLDRIDPQREHQKYQAHKNAPSKVRTPTL
jgi:hypothetical protein